MSPLLTSTRLLTYLYYISFCVGEFQCRAVYVKVNSPYGHQVRGNVKPDERNMMGNSGITAEINIYLRFEYGRPPQKQKIGFASISILTLLVTRFPHYIVLLAYFHFLPS